MTSRNVFPVELFERVIQLVHASQDVESLKNCSYASPALCALSQKLLFQEIRLSSDENPTGRTAADVPSSRISLWQAFSHLLDRSPHLSGYVHTLEITRNVLILVSQNNEDHDLEKILCRLPNQQKILITKDKIGKKNTPTFWDNIAPRIQNALLERFNSPRMVDIDLFGIVAFPAAHINGFPVTLKRLSITNLKSESDELDPLKYKVSLRAQNQETKMRYRFSLETLALRNVAQPGPTPMWLSSNICPIDLGKIQDLTLVMENHQQLNNSEVLKDLENLLKFFTSNLKRLTFRLRSSNMDVIHWSYSVYFDPYTLPPPDIAEILPSLQSLTLESSWYKLAEREAYKCPLSWINDLLKRSSGMHLRTIVLDMEIHVDEELLEEVEWGILLSGLDGRLISIIELRIAGLNQAGMKILLQNESLSKLPKGIVFM